MTEQRKNLYEKRSLTGALVNAAGCFLGQPPEQKTWKELEDFRKELGIIRDRVNTYFADVENYLMNNCPDWQEQWDLAQEVFLPYNDPYNPDDIDIEKLSTVFQEKGLNKELAHQVATSIKYPIES